MRVIEPATLAAIFLGASATDLPSREEISTIDIPALILGWTADPSHPIETAVELHKYLPWSTLDIAESYADLQRWPQLIREFVAKMN